MKEKIIHDEKMPTTFSQEEIAQILEAVDTCTAIGKRDYAILMCAVAYGWRSSDIVVLKLSSINWRTREISFMQRKTGVEAHKTLVSDVFLAMVDYIRNARPETKTKEVFVSVKDTNSPLSNAAINSIINKYLFRAGIKNLEKIKHKTQR